MPDFIAVPDRVADPDSLAFSMGWLERMRDEGWDQIAPLYLVVQDGMTPDAIPWDDFAGVFVGGTLPWKLASIEAWNREAHARGKVCHYGRCGTGRRVAQATAIGVDSLDSCLPLWGGDNLRAFMDALNQETIPGIS